MYKIKQIPEDFVVEEINDLSLAEKGSFYIYKMKKVNYNTLSAIKKIAKELRLSMKDVGYSGLKDKYAVTTQFISIANRKKLSKSYDFRDITLELKGFQYVRLFPGSLAGNHFEIIVRSIKSKPKPIKRMINYFGEQRFSKFNVEIGKSIVKKDLEKTKELLKQTNDYKSIEDEKSIINMLQKIDKKILFLYLQSYQSFLWNKSVEMHLKEAREDSSDKSSIKEMPLIGFGAIENKIIGKVMKKEAITKRDFIIKQLPDLSLEGGMRDIFVEVKNLKIKSLENDDLNKGMKKCKISFDLPKGSYATECIKQMIK